MSSIFVRQMNLVGAMLMVLCAAEYTANALNADLMNYEVSHGLLNSGVSSGDNDTSSTSSYTPMWNGADPLGVTTLRGGNYLLTTKSVACQGLDEGEYRPINCPTPYKTGSVCIEKCVGGKLKVELVGTVSASSGTSYTHLVGRACQNPVPLPPHATAGVIVENSHMSYGIACAVTRCDEANGWTVDTRNYGRCVQGAGTSTTASCDAGLFMVASGNQCECMSNYEWRDPNNHALGCVESSVARLKQECAAAGETTWNEDTSVCTCNDTNYEYNTDTKTCTETELYAQCQSLVSAGKAEWDDASKVCTCTQTNYLFSDGQCIEDPAIVAARNAENARVAKQKIENVHAKLKRKQDTLKVSAWKDADGEFNTARLASDSIAGAAVGAVGGLLINKHVKKNQVEDGFEALGCTVRGETVAQWGEEFSIDIKK